MLRLPEIQNRLRETEQGAFQKICNEILTAEGYFPYKLTGSVIGSNKTKKGTPDSVYKEKDGKYIYVEITTEQGKLSNKIKKDVQKCLDKIKTNQRLEGKISKIIFLHNQENIEEHLTEEIKQLCEKIEFEIWGIDTISLLLQNKYPEIAISELNMKDDSNMIEKFSDKALEQVANAVSNKSIEQYKNDTVNEIKNKINSLYEESISIINTSDAMVYISSENKEQLKIIFNKLKAFDFYYKNQNDDNAKLYYHNMLVILSKSELVKGIEFYDTMPDCAKNNNISQHFYSMLLIEQGRYNDAKDILEKLYFTDNYDDSFETLLRVYFLLEMYDEVTKLLSCAKVDKFDKYGFLAAMLIISKNYKNKYTESQLIKLNNSKFKKMPMFYTCTSKLLYDLDRRNKKYKEQFKKGLKYLNETDVIAIVTMCDQAIEIGLEDDAISYLKSIKLTTVLQNKLLELLPRKKELTKDEIELIENIDYSTVDPKINFRYLEAKVLESDGKELKAIKKYKESFENNNDINSVYRYVQLSLKNKADIDENAIRLLSDFNTVESLMLAVEAYNYIGKHDDAIKCSYKAIYLGDNNPKYRDSFKQYWTTIVLHDKKENENIESIVSDCVVILSDGKIKKKYLIEDDNYYKVGKKIIDAEIIRSNSDIGLDLLNLKKGDTINIKNKNFTVYDVLDKYTYLARFSFKYIKEDKNVKCLISKRDDPKEGIEQIRQEMLETNKKTNERLDVYQDSKALPLSSLLSRANDFDEYARLINTLLSDSNRILFAGERIDIDLKNGFVIDQTSLIVLSVFDALELIPEKLCNKIYITTSLKNKFQYFYENLIRKCGKTESNLYIINDDKLVLSETAVIDQIKFWRKLNKYIDTFNVVDIEMGKSNLINSKTTDVLDKVQFDLIELAKTKDLPFISDDLIIRKICNTYKVKHTNSLQIVKQFSKNEKQYIDIFMKYSKSNYLYTLYYDDLSEILKGLYSDFTEENKNQFTLIVESVLENKVCLEYYAPLLLSKVQQLKNVQYIQILDQVYENLFVTFIINLLNKTIQMKCDQFGINVNELN